MKVLKMAKENEEMEKLAQIKQVALEIFEPDAYTRFMTLLQLKPEKASKALEISIQYYSRKQKKISDEELKNLLSYINKPQETRIEIRRK
jgi:DNA-binding TFAR19-related protein (PDSD5 family)